MSAVTAPGTEAGRPRRPVPHAIRRRKLLLAIANHSVAIALSIAFLLPFVFILATSLMTNQQALSPSIWPRPFVWSTTRRCSSPSPSCATP